MNGVEELLILGEATVNGRDWLKIQEDLRGVLEDRGVGISSEKASPWKRGDTQGDSMREAPGCRAEHT